MGDELRVSVVDTGDPVVVSLGGPHDVPVAAEGWHLCMDPDRWARGADVDTPSAARMYDFYLGGSHNFAADRDAAREVIHAIPDVPLIARANRAFLQRAVGFLLAHGVRQFLDVGSGIPTLGNVHEVAQRINPDARVVYVDIDPVAVIHSRYLLQGNDRATAVLADLRRPDDILTLLEHHEGRAVLDLSKPVGLLLVSMLHFLPGDEAYQAVATLCAGLAPDSHLVISHAVTEGFDARAAGHALDVYRRTTTPGGLRTSVEVERFFHGFDLVSPGLVWLSQWRPDADNNRPRDPLAQQPARAGMVAGVARKPR